MMDEHAPTGHRHTSFIFEIPELSIDFEFGLRGHVQYFHAKVVQHFLTIKGLAFSDSQWNSFIDELKQQGPLTKHSECG